MRCYTPLSLNYWQYNDNRILAEYYLKAGNVKEYRRCKKLSKQAFKRYEYEIKNTTNQRVTG